MKGPKGILAESIATALADFFVVDQAAVETNLLRDAGIFLRNTETQTSNDTPLFVIAIRNGPR
jgi:hypothetical protein